jgi:hypothetical protein
MRRNIRMVSTYPPRRCGTGTFSRDPAPALAHFTGEAGLTKLVHLHTVLDSPDEHHKETIQQLAHCSDVRFKRERPSIFHKIRRVTSWENRTMQNENVAQAANAVSAVRVKET